MKMKFTNEMIRKAFLMNDSNPIKTINWLLTVKNQSNSININDVDDDNNTEFEEFSSSDSDSDSDHNPLEFLCNNSKILSKLKDNFINDSEDINKSIDLMIKELSSKISGQKLLNSITFNTLVNQENLLEFIINLMDDKNIDKISCHSNEIGNVKIKKIKALGFDDEHEILQAYFACNKNVKNTINLLNKHNKNN